MPALPDRPFIGPAAWVGSELPADAGIVPLTSETLEEIARLARLLDDNPIPTLALDPGDFELLACRGVMGKAHAALTEGPGFVIIDRLPLEALQREGVNI